MFILTACVKTPGGPTSRNFSGDAAPGQLHPASPQITPSDIGDRKRQRIILPNPALMGCKTGNCTQMLPDKVAEPDGIYPWQVLVDFNGGEVIGLMAFYDRPTSIDDLQAAIDERYGKWAIPSSRTAPVRLWRV